MRQGPNGPDDTPGDYLSPHPLPVELPVARAGTPARLYVCDDLAARHGRGEVARCELRVRLFNLIETDRFDLYLNDTPIPRSAQQWLDWTYSSRHVRTPTRILNHYWIVVDLARNGPLPDIGDNRVRVDLIEHDPRVVHPVMLHDVELVVDYRDHRHRPRLEEQWGQ